VTRAPRRRLPPACVFLDNFGCPNPARSAP
jgi:hypothetical protein